MNDKYKVCGRCIHWQPSLDNGQCNLDSHYCECDDEGCKNIKLSYIDEILMKYSRNK